MKKIALLVVLSTMASAANAGTRWSSWYNWWTNWQPATTTQTTAHAPEIDPASTGAALTLLIGGLAVLRSRVVRKGK